MERLRKTRWTYHDTAGTRGNDLTPAKATPLNGVSQTEPSALVFQSFRSAMQMQRDFYIKKNASRSQIPRRSDCSGSQFSMKCINFGAGDARLASKLNELIQYVKRSSNEKTITKPIQKLSHDKVSGMINLDLWLNQSAEHSEHSKG